jgi:sugar lactone lactonase YvrE
MKRHAFVTSCILLFLLALPPLHLRAQAAPGDYLFQVGEQPLLRSAAGGAVDSSGNIYLVDSYSFKVKKFSSSGALLRQWGGPTSSVGQPYSPVAVTLDGSDNLLIADNSLYSIRKIDSSGNLLAQFGSRGSANGQFEYIGGLAVDGAGSIFVSDASQSSISKFDRSGVFLQRWGTGGAGIGQFAWPSSLAVDRSGYVYVADLQNNRIQKFDNSGTFVYAFGIAGTGNGEFQNPWGVAVDGAGNVYVADTGNNRIQKFDHTGAYLAQWGNSGSNNWYSVVVDNDGNILAIGGDSVKKYDPHGTLLMQFGGTSADGQIVSAHGLAVDDSGNIFVADSGNSRIQKFNSAGAYLAKWGASGSDAGQFVGPYGVAVDSRGNVFTTDGSKGRIQKFDSLGGYLTQWNLKIPDGDYYGAPGMAVGHSGNVYLTNGMDNLIQKYDGFGTYLAGWEGVLGRSALAADQSEHLYQAADNQLVEYDSSGQFVAKWENSTGFNGNPGTLAVDRSHNVYSIMQGSTVQVFDSTGALLGVVGGYGFDEGQLFSPYALATNASGTILYVSDVFKVQAFAGYGFNGFVLKYAAGANGSISGAAVQNVSPGGSGTPVTAVANAGYRFVSWSDGVTSAARTDRDLKADLTLTASFVPLRVIISFSSGNHGNICGKLFQSIAYNGSTSPVTALPAAGHHFVSWTGSNGFLTSRDNPLTVKNSKVSQSVSANFAINQYTISFAAGRNGSIAGDTSQQVSYGGSTTAVVAIPYRGFHFVSWTNENNRVVGTRATLTLGNLSASQRITANFSR